jgi:hypothetical protein
VDQHDPFCSSDHVFQNTTFYLTKALSWQLLLFSSDLNFLKKMSQDYFDTKDFSF